MDYENSDKDILEVLLVSDDGTIKDLNMVVIDSVTPFYEIIESDENRLQIDPLNSAFEQLKMRNSISIDLSKIEYNQDPCPYNAQTFKFDYRTSKTFI